ncbi:hypothetical protein WICPIJ_004494, partial [Wickerhamomyces pijperi]
NNSDLGTRLFSSFELLTWVGLGLVNVFGLDTSSPQLLSNSHTFWQVPSPAFTTTESHDEDLSGGRLDSVSGSSGFDQGENTLDTEGDTDTWNRHVLLTGRRGKHVDQVVVTATSSNGANTYIFGGVFVVGLLLGLQLRSVLWGSGGRGDSFYVDKVAMSCNPALADSSEVNSSLDCKIARTSSRDPFNLTYSPILSAVSSVCPFSSTISFLTASQGDLSSLSTAEEIFLTSSSLTPQTLKIPSKIFLWLSLILNSLMPKLVKPSTRMAKTSASGTMESY